MGRELLDAYSSVPEKGDTVVVDLGAKKLPAFVRCGTVEGRNETTVLVRVKPLFNQGRSGLLKVDIDDVAVAIALKDTQTK